MLKKKQTKKTVKTKMNSGEKMTAAGNEAISIPTKWL